MADSASVADADALMKVLWNSFRMAQVTLSEPYLPECWYGPQEPFLF